MYWDDTETSAYGSGGYGFITGKRKRVVSGAGEKSCQAPDLVTLKDGREYRVTGVDKGVVQELVSYSFDAVFGYVLIVLQ